MKSNLTKNKDFFVMAGGLRKALTDQQMLTKEQIANLQDVFASLGAKIAGPLADQLTHLVSESSRLNQRQPITKDVFAQLKHSVSDGDDAVSAAEHAATRYTLTSSQLDDVVQSTSPDWKADVARVLIESTIGLDAGTARHLLDSIPASPDRDFLEADLAQITAGSLKAIVRPLRNDQLDNFVGEIPRLSDHAGLIQNYVARYTLTFEQAMAVAEATGEGTWPPNAMMLMLKAIRDLKPSHYDAIKSSFSHSQQRDELLRMLESRFTLK